MQQAAPNSKSRPSIFGAAKQAHEDALRTISAMPRVMLWGFLALTLLNLLNQFTDKLIGRLGTTFPADVTNYGIAVIWNLAAVPVLIATHRFILLDESTRDYSIRLRDRDFRRFFIGAVLVYTLLQLPNEIRFIYFAQEFSYVILGTLFAAFVTLRLIILFPAIAIGAPRSEPLWHAYYDMKGHVMRTFAIFVVASIPIFVLLILVAIPTGAIDARMQDPTGTFSLIFTTLSGVFQIFYLTLYAAIASRLLLAFGARVLALGGNQLISGARCQGMTLPQRIFLVLISFAVSCSCAHAEWPDRPIRIIAPSTAGGAADTFARVLADKLAPMLGATIIVDNRTGGGGLVGVAATSQAAPDGYTLVISSAAYNTIEPFVSANPGFDPQRGFTHIAYMGGQPNTFVVSAKSEFRSMPEIVEAAKAGRGIDYVSPGVGTLGHLLMELLAAQAGVKLQHIPHRGASQAMLDLVAGTVPLGTMTWGSAIGQIRAGTVRPVAISSEKRAAEFPDVPTLQELGYGLVANSWFGLSGPPGLPAVIVTRLNRGAIEVLARPEVRTKFDADGITSPPMTPEEFAALVAADIAKWQPAVKRLGLAH